MPRRTNLTLALLTLLAATPARAQFGGLLNQAQQRARDVANQAAKDAQKPKPASPAPAPAPPPAPVAKTPSPDEQPQAVAPMAANTGSSPVPPSANPAVVSGVYSPRFDFVPGENVLFFDDFSDTEPGDYPAKWTTGGDQGQVEVVDLKGKHWLKAIKPTTGKSMPLASTGLRVDYKKKLPAKFTVEFDIPSSGAFAVRFSDRPSASGDYVFIGPSYVETRRAKDNQLPAPSQPIRHVSIAASNTNVKVYFDGERVLLDPEGLPSAGPEVKQGPASVFIQFRPDGPPQGNWGGALYTTIRDDLMFTNFKLAEGGKDYAKDLAVSGRIVTHGITFDSGSDVLRPESGPTLRKILKLLQDEASLAFEIQGHTDSQGSDKVNVPLSQARAAAVKAWLVGQGIDPGRLTTKGLGASKPLQSNDTPEGRADNRRVEFVKTS
jgi:OOP family OmpA-OmpF porin